MSRMRHVAGIGIVLLLLGIAIIWARSSMRPESAFHTAVTEGFPGFITDTNQTSIDLGQILPGGPGKDGIPALTNPKYVYARDSLEADDGLGVLISINGDNRFYPYSILVWHEIVNDMVGDIPVAVTYCPLCGTAIAYDRRVGGEVLEFGVSGYLYESNMVMFDRTTESFWIQATGQSVVGQRIGQRLGLVDADLMTFAQAKLAHDNLRVLSRETGYRRDYENPPYEGYEDTDQVIFPVSSFPETLPPKTLLYVVPVHGLWLAVPRDDVLEAGEHRFSYSQGVVKISNQDGSLSALVNGEEYPGYFEMWFSFAIHHADDGELVGTLSAE